MGQTTLFFDQYEDVEPFIQESIRYMDSDLIDFNPIHNEATINLLPCQQVIYDEPESVTASYEASDATSLFSEYSSRSKDYELNPFEACFKSKLIKGTEPNPFEESFKTITPSVKKLPSYSRLKTESYASQISESTQGSLINTSNSSPKEILRKKNRASAAKSRQKKREWLLNQENEIKKLEAHNNLLSENIIELKNEILNIQMILAAHTNCELK